MQSEAAKTLNNIPSEDEPADTLSSKTPFTKKRFKLHYLKCICPTEAFRILREIHDRVCGNHIGSRSLAQKALHQGYNWPTMKKDT